jgi:transcriptional pleiotropic regulator of transition state genes
MFSINSAPSLEPTTQSSRQSVILPFDRLPHTKEQFQPCIFCGETIKVHKFKGKTVCIHCLRQIPSIFSCG